MRAFTYKVIKIRSNVSLIIIMIYLSIINTTFSALFHELRCLFHPLFCIICTISNDIKFGDSVFLSREDDRYTSCSLLYLLHRVLYYLIGLYLTGNSHNTQRDLRSNSLHKNMLQYKSILFLPF